MAPPLTPEYTMVFTDRLLILCILLLLIVIVSLLGYIAATTSRDRH